MFKDGGLPPLLKSLFVLAALINAVGWICDEYTKIVWYDEFAHFFTSFSVALVLGFFSYRRAASYRRHHHLDYFIVVACFGVTAGAIWEVLEWFIVMGEFADSPICDIVYDTLGALAAGALSVWFVQRSAFEASKEAKCST